MLNKNTDTADGKLERVAYELVSIDIPLSPNPKDKTINICSQDQEVIEISSLEDNNKRCGKEEEQTETYFKKDHKRKDPPREPDRLSKDNRHAVEEIHGKTAYKTEHQLDRANIQRQKPQASRSSRNEQLLCSNVQIAEKPQASYRSSGKEQLQHSNVQRLIPQASRSSRNEPQLDAALLERAKMLLAEKDPKEPLEHYLPPDMLHTASSTIGLKKWTGDQMAAKRIEQR